MTCGGKLKNKLLVVTAHYDVVSLKRSKNLPFGGKGGLNFNILCDYNLQKED